MHGQKNINKKIVCVGCTERTLVVSILHYYFICLHCVVQVSMHYRLCLITVYIKVLQNGRLVRFSKRTDGWYTFSWSIYNQNVDFVSCIQTNSFQGYDLLTYLLHGADSFLRS